GTADGVGPEARFSGEPEYIVMDSAGAFYISDTASHTIRKMTPDGTVTTFAGAPGASGFVDGAGAKARLNRPNGLALDASGALYVAEEGNDAIRRITPDGTVTTLADKLGIMPAAIALDAAGNVYTGGWDGHVILKITPDGTVTPFAGKTGVEGTKGTAVPIDGTGSAARFYALIDLKVDAQGVLYVVEWREEDASGDIYGALRKVTPDGTVTTLRTDWVTPGAPGALWIDPSGVLYATSFYDQTVMKIGPDGTATVLAGMRGEANAGYRDGPGDVARFNGPVGIVRDASGLFYVVDLANSVVRTMRCS
ncbi:MAG: repeat containing protein, partial [Chloroflexi bacterium]|nr:repeat containing protein [Chloroflexota bacterium]